MKNALIFILAFFTLTACNQTQKTGNEGDSSDTTIVTANKSIELTVHGMTCEGCENTIEKTLAGMEGIVSTEASYIDSVTTVSFDSTKVNISQIADAINNIGYTVVDDKSEK